MMETFSLANVHVIDAVNDSTSGRCTVEVEDGRIVDIVSSPSGHSRVVDGQGLYACPGLWDAHSHLSSHKPVPASETTAERTMRCVGAAVEALHAGITSIRSAGEADFVDCAISRYFDEGPLVGPRVVPAGYLLSTTAGHGISHPKVRQLDGPVEFRRAVRENIRAGAKWIKADMSGGMYGPAWDRFDTNIYAPDETEAIFQTAHQRGLPVMVHAGNPEAVRLAVEAGARSIEHGYTLDESAVAAMAEAGVYYVPTLCISQLNLPRELDEWELAFNGNHYVPPHTLERIREVARVTAWGFSAAHEAGVKIVCGSDSHPLALAVKVEVALMVKLGMSTSEALLTATLNAAEMCMVEAETGSIEVGKDADLVLLRDNPLSDIHALHQVAGVWRRGWLVGNAPIRELVANSEMLDAGPGVPRER